MALTKKGPFLVLTLFLFAPFASTATTTSSLSYVHARVPPNDSPSWAAGASPDCNVTIRTDASTFAPSLTMTLQSNKKYVMLRFDDTFQDQWVNALPILQKYGFKATFAVIVGGVQNQSVIRLSNGWEEMSWQEVQSLYNSGNEIGDHTMTHADLAYQGCSDLNYQIAYSKYVLAQHGMTYVPALILPYGDGFHNDTVTSFAYRAWFQHVYSDPGSPALSEYSNPNITTTWYDIDAGSGQSLLRFEYLANRASSTNIVGFTFHHIDDHVGDTTYYVNYTNFLQDMIYLNESGFTVILPSNLPSYMNTYPTLSYSVLGGGSYSPPMLTYTQNGVTQTTPLSTTPTTYYADPGTFWRVSNSLPGSSETERWQANQVMGDRAMSPQAIGFEYYHQYYSTFDYGVIGGGFRYSQPTISYTQFGLKENAPLGSAVWVDAGSGYSFPTSLKGSMSSERWQENTNDESRTNIVTSSATYTVLYYHQFKSFFSYQTNDGSSSSISPSLTATQFGSLVYLPILSTTSGGQSNSYWLDSGTKWSIPEQFHGSTNGERWIISDGESDNGTVASNFSVTATYNHQYYLSVKSTVPDDALTSPQSGWYADGSIASISASVAEGYKFENWVGFGQNSYTGSRESAAVTINSPINETAEIYVGLTITAANDGSVSYTYGSLRGEVPAGASRTIYVPSGARVFIKASPSSFLYKFSLWKGDAISSVDGTLYVVVNSPSTISGNFSLDVSVLAMLALLVIGMGIVVGIKKNAMLRLKPSP